MEDLGLDRLFGCWWNKPCLLDVSYFGFGRMLENPVLLHDGSGVRVLVCYKQP